MNSLYQTTVVAIKRALFANRGEPYRFGNEILRFLPGTRPVRLKYRHSTNGINRNDALQVALVLDRVKEGDRAVDIGGHAGQYGILLAARCGRSGRVVSFEPDPDAAETYRRNVALNPSLRPPELVHKACSDRAGSATFFTQGGNSQSSLARSALPKDRATQAITVETVRLDDWWFREERAAPDFVKIDTEGAEVHILRGMPRILDSNAVIVCELHPFAWDEFGVSFAELAQVVAKSGRQMCWLDNGEIVREPVVYGTVLIRRNA